MYETLIERERPLVLRAQRLGNSIGRLVRARAALDTTPAAAPERKTREDAVAAAKRAVVDARGDLRAAIRDAYERNYAIREIENALRDAYPEDAS